MKEDFFELAGGRYKSRLIVGTGKYRDFAETRAAIEESGAEIVTVAVRRVNITDPNNPSLQLVLVAPDGTMVPLVAAGTASGANFTNTTFSDAPAANSAAVAMPNEGPANTPGTPAN